MAKKTVTKKAVAKKAAAPAKKAAAKKSVAPSSVPAPVKKAAVKKTATKKTATKKVAAAPKAVATPPSPVSTPTAVVATIDVGFGNTLYIRGDGPGLSWDRGVMMECQADDRWEWSTYEAKASFLYKVLINDEIWASGEDLTALPGKINGISPSFA